jgi:xanthine dehydrogenase YagS FAD-binding subunit
MTPFTYITVTQAGQAIDERANRSHAAFLAGGTNLIDHLKLGVEQPDCLIDVNKLPLDKIEALHGGGYRIGATVRNTELAYDPNIQAKYPALSQAILSGASPQLRNAATTAGNILQRTRCYYFRDTASPCNKREPGSGCAAINGFNRIHAVLGTSDKCIATHPSDMDVALVAFDAVIRTKGPNGERTIPINDFYISYGDDPAKENVLEPGELITAVDLPAIPWFARSTYIKLRDRASYEFSLSSAAIALDIDNGTIREARVALGGVATKPWRARAAEQSLKGAKLGDDAFTAAADAELMSAVPRKYNAFKIELCKRVIVRALQTAAAIT